MVRRVREGGPGTPPAGATRWAAGAPPRGEWTRREFLALPLALAAVPAGAAQSETRTSAYDASVGILYDALSFQLAGTIKESIDRDGGRYEVRLEGQGTGIVNRGEVTGVLRDGRWAPLRSNSMFLVHGREFRSQVAYDYAQRTIDYRSRSETFFLRRLRVAEDVVRMPDGTHVDDVFSATLNHAEGRWEPQPDGTLRTHVVRRRRGSNEGVDDVEKAYRAEIVPFVLKVAPDPASGGGTALFDLSRFSSWAREDRPARIVFGPDRRPQVITSSLMLGTSVTIRIASA
ncbi:MAG: hypothetical protein ACRELA_23790 [Candidatus Rokuibacteriota bacterium]